MLLSFLWGGRLQGGELLFLSSPYFGFRSGKFREIQRIFCIFFSCGYICTYKQDAAWKASEAYNEKNYKHVIAWFRFLSWAESQREAETISGLLLNKGHDPRRDCTRASCGNGCTNQKGIWWPLNGFAFPRPNRRKNSEPAHFLHACFLCKRRLVPGRDIYMYRGDSAFCSIECRHQQIVLDERKEKRSVIAMKKESVPSNQHQNTSNQGSHSETAAAA